MKRFVLATALLAFATSAGLRAQTVYLKASIPFEFRMGEVLMPAGEYTVHQRGSGLVTLRTETGAVKSATFLTLPTSRRSAQTSGALVFNRYGDDYFLSTVWSPDSRDGRVLPKSSQERELISRAGQVQTADVRLRSK